MIRGRRFIRDLRPDGTAPARPNEPFVLAGRLLEIGPTHLLVEDETGRLRLEQPLRATGYPLRATGYPLRPQDHQQLGDEDLGAWAVVRGDGAVAAEVEIVQRAIRPFGSEWQWWNAADQRRSAILRQRARILAAIRDYFAQRDVLEVETPLAVPSPGLDLHLSAFEVDQSFLITSPEYQMKRLLAGGFERIYQICKCFRRDEAGARHQPEFTMLEWYRAFASSEELMRDTERLCAYVAQRVLGATTIGELELGQPWDRLPVAQAFARYAPDVDQNDDEAFFHALAFRIEPQLGHQRPVFLTEWPARMASLAQLIPGTNHADRFEAFVRGIELCNGFGELTDPVEQRRRLERDRDERIRLGHPAYPIDERFLDALEEGIPPCSGNALGVDRLVMLLCGVEQIDDVVGFSRARL